MPQRCRLCDHPKRAEIDRAIVAKSIPSRRMATQYGVDPKTITNHRNRHITAEVAKAVQRTGERRADDLLAELDRIRVFIDKLLTACDEWLTDANDPAKYDIGPRSSDLWVTYYVAGPQGELVRRKAKLSTLVDAVEARDEVLTVELIETRYADPRELVLKAVARLQAHVELLGRILGEIEPGASVNVFLLPEWQAVLATINRVLASHRPLRLQLAAELRRLTAGEAA